VSYTGSGDKQDLVGAVAKAFQVPWNSGASRCSGAWRSREGEAIGCTAAGWLRA